jgi:hypothetical protein
MARGQAQAADAQLGLTNQVAGQQGAQAQGILGVDMPAVMNQINPSATTRSAMTQLPTQGANAAFNARQQSNAQRVAKTNNSAGYGALSDKLAMDKGQADSTAALQGQTAITNLQNEGVKNAGNLFGVSTDTMAKMYGLGPSTLQARAAGQSGDQAAQGWISTIGKLGL